MSRITKWLYWISTAYSLLGILGFAATIRLPQGDRQIFTLILGSISIIAGAVSFNIAGIRRDAEKKRNHNISHLISILREIFSDEWWVNRGMIQNGYHFKVDELLNLFAKPFKPFVREDVWREREAWRICALALHIISKRLKEWFDAQDKHRATVKKVMSEEHSSGSRGPGFLQGLFDEEKRIEAGIEKVKGYFDSLLLTAIDLGVPLFDSKQYRYQWYYVLDVPKESDAEMYADVPSRMTP